MSRFLFSKVLQSSPKFSNLLQSSPKFGVSVAPDAEFFSASNALCIYAFRWVAFRSDRSIISKPNPIYFARMKRRNGIFIKTTEEEKKVIQENADSLNTNVSRLLRFFGIRSKNFYRARYFLRRSFARINQIHRIARSTDSNQLQQAVEELNENLQELEESLSKSEKLTE